MLRPYLNILFLDLCLAVIGFAATPKAYFSQDQTGDVVAVSTSTNKTVAKIANGYGTAGVISQNGKVLLEPGTNSLAVIDTASKQVLKTIPLAYTRSNSAAITSDGAMAFAATGTSIGFFDVASGTMNNSVSLPNSSTSASIFVAISPDNTTLYTLYNGNRTVNLCAITVASASIRACQPMPASYDMIIFTRALAVSADGTRVYAFSSEYDLGVFDSNSLAMLNSLQVVDPANSALGSLVYSQAQNAVYLASYNSVALTGNLYRIDLATFTVTAQQSLRLQPLDVAVTPNGSAVYWAAHMGYPNAVYDGSTLAQIGTVSPGPTRSVVIGPQ